MSTYCGSRKKEILLEDITNGLKNWILIKYIQQCVVFLYEYIKITHGASKILLMMKHVGNFQELLLVLFFSEFCNRFSTDKLKAAGLIMVIAVINV